MLYSLKNFKVLHMFFKELLHVLYCLVINVHLCCLSVVCVSNSFILSCVVSFVNNFFKNFFCFVPALSKKALGTQRRFLFLLLSHATALLDYHILFTLSTTFFIFLKKQKFLYLYKDSSLPALLLQPFP